jgi:hypothetical protein
VAQLYLIGIGGSGAKVVEAFVHLCAAGIGPDRAVCISLVDQDKDNGNVKQTLRLVHAYRDLHERLHPRGTGSSCDFFKTSIELDKDTPWQPEVESGVTLRDLLGHGTLPSLDRGVLDCLFLGSEQQEPLNWGFRGRPALGAATLARKEHTVWQRWTETINASAQANPGARVFVTGSICGGTGAAGFPTLSRLLREDCNRERVVIGGALMLPYFAFNPPPQQPPPPAKQEVVADSAAFIEQTSAALKFYYQLLRDEKDEEVFKNIYLLGWDPLIKLDSFQPGGPDQRNPPLIPELYAGLATSRFLSEPEFPEKPIQYTGWRETVEGFQGPTVCWGDLPTVGKLGKAWPSPRTPLGQFLRFTHVYNSIYAPGLIDGASRRHRHHFWFKHLIDRAEVKIGDRETQTTLVALRDYCRMFLTYIADMSYVMEGKQIRIALADVGQFAEPVRDSEREWSRLNGALSAFAEQNFAQLILDDPRERTESTGLQDIFEKLNHRRPESHHRGIAVFCAALYDCCALT